MTQNNRVKRHALPELRVRGFTLIELLTVIFIISLLIAILLPSLNGARNAAKRISTDALMNNSIKVGLELFKGDNERDFMQTNGYPPSFSHPTIGTAAFMSHSGQFPFLTQYPKVYGAHWLPFALLGLDKLGFIKRSSVPADTTNMLQNKPELWYKSNPTNANPPMILPRQTHYIDLATRTVATRDLMRAPPVDLQHFFPDWSTSGGPVTPEVDTMAELPVIVDSFDQPILYYAANKFGTPTNMVSKIHIQANNYTGGEQMNGQPYYFHIDNAGFTGDDAAQEGWRLNQNGKHKIAKSGADLSASQLVSAEGNDTFARYILSGYSGATTNLFGSAAPLKPVNADSYLLISAGVDGYFGTPDDITNFPKQNK